MMEKMNADDYEYVRRMAQLAADLVRAYQDRIDVVQLRSEVEEWKRKYDELVQENIRHSEEMIGGILHAELSRQKETT
jgi:hypothetical protein